MLKSIKKTYYAAGAAFMVGAIAAPGVALAGNNFSSIASNITASTTSIPGMLTALAYLFGILLGVLGVLKIRSDERRVGQACRSGWSTRQAEGSALFALPILFESMFETVGAKGNNASAAKLNKAKFNV